jgi:hypothetical protein
MKKIFAVAALAAAGIMAVPAVAQLDVSEDGYCDNSRATDLTWQIRREARELDIDLNTARELRAEVDRTAALENHYCATGLTAWRAKRLDRQYAQIEEELRAEALG